MHEMREVCSSSSPPTMISLFSPQLTAACRDTPLETSAPCNPQATSPSACGGPDAPAARSTSARLSSASSSSASPRKSWPPQTRSEFAAEPMTVCVWWKRGVGRRGDCASPSACTSHQCHKWASAASPSGPRSHVSLSRYLGLPCWSTTKPPKMQSHSRPALSRSTPPPPPSAVKVRAQGASPEPGSRRSTCTVAASRQREGSWVERSSTQAQRLGAERVSPPRTMSVLPSLHTKVACATIAFGWPS
eukprot:scaffold19403_cov66-Phaeocystis_antarctica.AAC.3